MIFYVTTARETQHAWNHGVAIASDWYCSAICHVEVQGAVLHSLQLALSMPAAAGRKSCCAALSSLMLNNCSPLWIQVQQIKEGHIILIADCCTWFAPLLQQASQSMKIACPTRVTVGGPAWLASLPKARKVRRFRTSDWCQWVAKPVSVSRQTCLAVLLGSRLRLEGWQQSLRLQFLLTALMDIGAEGLKAAFSNLNLLISSLAMLPSAPDSRTSCQLLQHDSWGKT